MAIINKKLVHFRTKTKFDEYLAANDILDTSIVFIQDEKLIWTHGTFYNEDEVEITETGSPLGDPKIWIDCSGETPSIKYLNPTWDGQDANTKYVALGLEDAPNDGKAYNRKDGTWEAAPLVLDSVRSESTTDALSAKRGNWLVNRHLNLAKVVRYSPIQGKFSLFDDTSITTFTQFKEIFDCFKDNLGNAVVNPFEDITELTPETLADVVNGFSSFVASNTLVYNNKTITPSIQEFAYCEGKSVNTNCYALSLLVGSPAQITIDNPITPETTDYLGFQTEMVHTMAIDKSTAEVLDYDRGNRYFTFSQKMMTEVAGLLIGATDSPYISKTNESVYTPTSAYNPSTKKYVDDAINTIKINGATTYDASAFIKANATYGQSTFNITTDQFTELGNAVKAGSLIYVNVSGNKILCTTSRMPVDTQIVLACQNQGYGFVNSTAGVNTTRVTFIIRSTGVVTQYSALANIISTGDGSMCQNDAGGYTGVLSTGVNPKDFTPTHNNHPATKKYVDDAVAAVPAGGSQINIIDSVDSNILLTAGNGTISQKSIDLIKNTIDTGNPLYLYYRADGVAITLPVKTSEYDSVNNMSVLSYEYSMVQETGNKFLESGNAIVNLNNGTINVTQVTGYNSTKVVTLSQYESYGTAVETDDVLYFITE